MSEVELQRVYHDRLHCEDLQCERKLEKQVTLEKKLAKKKLESNLIMRICFIENINKVVDFRCKDFFVLACNQHGCATCIEKRKKAQRDMQM